MQHQQISKEQYIEETIAKWKRFHSDAGMFEAHFKEHPPTKIIGIAGLAGSGKSTLCEMLLKKMDSDTEILSFAEPLKMLAYQMGWDGVKDEKGRRLLQTLGTEVGRDCIDERLWLKHWIHGIRQLQGAPLICTDDARFVNERELIKSFGGTTIHISGRNDIASGSEHSSETQMDDVYDYRIVNDGTVDELETKVDYILKDSLKWIS